MKKKTAFSLAEALITLLIVSLIVAMTAPIITKKKRAKLDNVNYWINSTVYPNTIESIGGKDLVLGNINKQKHDIVISGILEIKNTKGETIGWIAEDGTSSFGTQQSSTNVEYLENQRKIIEMLNDLQQILIMNNNITNATNTKNATASTHFTEEQLQKYFDDIIKTMNNR